MNRRGDGPAGTGAGFGIGIDTTRERLERLFGPAAALELETTDEDLVTTRLSLPFQSAATVVEAPGSSEGAR